MLEKLSKGLTGELTTSLNPALILSQAFLQKIANTVASHTTTISGMETALSAHSDGTADWKHELATLKAQLVVENLESGSKWQKLCMRDIPEEMEEHNGQHFTDVLWILAWVHALNGTVLILWLPHFHLFHARIHTTSV